MILATGAQPLRPELERLDDPVVLDAWQVIRGARTPRGRILVADWRGDWVGLGVALLLAQQGRRVTLGVTGFAAGEHLQQYVRAAMLAAAVRAKIEVLPNVRLYGADNDTAYLQHTLTEEPVIVDDIAAVVLAQGHTPVTDLTDHPGAVSIGDCVSPRSVEEAVLEGLRAGATV